MLDQGNVVFRDGEVYVRKHYGEGIVVFDGYEDSSTKSNEHSRRTGDKAKCPDKEVMGSNKIQVTQERFLSNVYNKTQIIKLISAYRRDDSHIVINCISDADSNIVSTALQYSVGERPVVAVADDTDIIIMLLYHYKEEMGDLIFFQHRMNRGWNMKAVLEV